MVFPSAWDRVFPQVQQARDVLSVAAWAVPTDEPKAILTERERLSLSDASCSLAWQPDAA